MTRNPDPYLPPDARSLVAVTNFTVTRSGLEGGWRGLATGRLVWVGEWLSGRYKMREGAQMLESCVQGLSNNQVFFAVSRRHSRASC